MDNKIYDLNNIDKQKEHLLSRDFSIESRLLIFGAVFAFFTGLGILFMLFAIPFTVFRPKAVQKSMNEVISGYNSVYGIDIKDIKLKNNYFSMHLKAFIGSCLLFGTVVFAVSQFDYFASITAVALFFLSYAIYFLGYFIMVLISFNDEQEHLGRLFKERIAEGIKTKENKDRNKFKIQQD